MITESYEYMTNGVLLYWTCRNWKETRILVVVVVVVVVVTWC